MRAAECRPSRRDATETVFPAPCPFLTRSGTLWQPWRGAAAAPILLVDGREAARSRRVPVGGRRRRRRPALRRSHHVGAARPARRRRLDRAGRDQGGVPVRVADLRDQPALAHVSSRELPARDHRPRAQAGDPHLGRDRGPAGGRADDDVSLRDRLDGVERALARRAPADALGHGRAAAGRPLRQLRLDGARLRRHALDVAVDASRGDARAHDGAVRRSRARTGRRSGSSSRRCTDTRT